MHQQNKHLDLLAEIAKLTSAEVYAGCSTRPAGLTPAEAAERLALGGANVLANEQRTSFISLLRHAVLNPLVVLMSVLAGVSVATGDPRAAAVMIAMILLGVGLRLVQESRADRAVASLRAMISLKANVQRDQQVFEIPMRELVPGDVIHLSSGAMVPGDVRIVAAKDLSISQSVLTGESVPVEKVADANAAATLSPFKLATVAFMGSRVESGAGIRAVSMPTNGRIPSRMKWRSLSMAMPPFLIRRRIVRTTRLPRCGNMASQ